METNKEKLQKQLKELENKRKDILNGVYDQETEVYSRIVGYYRSVSNFNKGRAQEFKDRKTYKV